jgi:hypothetical protein
MDFSTVIVISLAFILIVGLIAIILGPLFGWRIAARNERFIPFPSKIEAQEKIRDAFMEQGWEIESDNPDRMIARTKVSWRSWGEIIKVEFQDEGALVSSQCSLHTQAIDYGKNRMNIQRLVDSVMKKTA